MLKKVLLIGVPSRLRHTATIETKALGVWHETGASPAHKLTIRRDGRATDRVWYTVTCPRSFKVPFSASLDGRRIVIWGENAISDPVWYVTYDAHPGTLTVTRPISGEHFALRRLSD